MLPNAWEFEIALMFSFDAYCLWSLWLIFQQKSEVVSENEIPLYTSSDVQTHFTSMKSKQIT